MAPPVPDLDLAILVGTLSSDPSTLDLSSGSVLHRYEVTVRDRDQPAQTVPVAWFDPPRPPALAAGDAVVVVGAVRRRFFRAGGVTRSTTEVVARHVGRAGGRSAVAARRGIVDALEAVRATVDSGDPGEAA